MNAFLEENSLTGTCSTRSAVVETKATAAGIIAMGYSVTIIQIAM